MTAGQMGPEKVTIIVNQDPEKSRKAFGKGDLKLDYGLQRRLLRHGLNAQPFADHTVTTNRNHHSPGSCFVNSL
jgi:hypothetical protein